MDTQYLVISLVLLFGIYISKGTFVCPDGWHKHNNNECYWFSVNNATRQGAQSECASMNSSLATINNININSFLQKHTFHDTNISYWIGLSIPNLRGEAWQWTNGLNLDSRHVDWCDGNGRAENILSSCTVAYYFKNATFCLKTYGCDTPRRFVCEKVIDRKTLCPSHLYNNSYGERTSCYALSIVAEDHTDAAKVCWSKGMRLVTVPDDAARRFMESISPGSGKVYWVGLSPYKWDDGSIYNWHNWDTGTVITLKCTVLQNDGKWHPSNCSVFNRFICQKGATIDDLSTSTTELSTTTSSVDYNTMERRNDISISTDEITNQLISDPDTSPLATKTDTPLPPLMTNRTKNSVVLFIIIGIMSVIIVGFTIAVGALVLYIKRTLNNKESTSSHSHSPKQDILHEDTSATAYYNVNTESSVVNRTESDDQIRHSSELKTDATDIQKSSKVYEVLDPGLYVNGLQHEVSGPYATLK